VTDIAPELIIEERLCRVDELDLEPVVFKLMHREDGEPVLDLPRADQDAALYRCFWKLCVLYPHTTIVPTRRIDRVWHTHILDTVRYRADCDRVFGRFMDHFPYAGLRGEDDRRAWRADFATTRALFQKHFAVDIDAEAAASVCRNHGDGSECCFGPARPPALHSRPRPARGGIVA